MVSGPGPILQIPRYLAHSLILRGGCCHLCQYPSEPHSSFGKLDSKVELHFISALVRGKGWLLRACSEHQPLWKPDSILDMSWPPHHRIYSLYAKAQTQILFEGASGRTSSASYQRRVFLLSSVSPGSEEEGIVCQEQVAPWHLSLTSCGKPLSS